VDGLEAASRQGDGMLVVGIVAPFVSLLVGAGLTYWLNVRQRQRTYVDDLFKRAIEAVYAADASVDYTSHIGRPERLSEAGWQELQDWFVVQGMQQWWQRQVEANQALAHVRAYRPEVGALLPFRLDADHREVEQVVALLRLGPCEAEGGPGGSAATS
jgi:hypothetical protein